MNTFVKSVFLLLAVSANADKIWEPSDSAKLNAANFEEELNDVSVGLRRSTKSCVPDDRPRPVRDGQRFRFNLVKSNAKCVDDRDRLYEYGEFRNSDDFGECAEMCVNDVRSSLAMGDNFRGFDYECSRRRCRCLYDAGTLDSRNSGRFDRTNRDERGRNSIDGTTKKSDFYCGKLVGAEAVEEVSVA